ncbi:helix-turn-helix transcriptional regulator [Streptomyces bomunensis]|uniref:Helix-turn-helix transcriptional regulator n=1 Tax=Streptomyces montanisoli TaxID=2798581 RepID=A0A940MHC0_9ACTN|nr:helix-turn-helix transcriptional regulator [Streptomyces montanisoli]
MPVNTTAGTAGTPPFDAGAARRMREALGMTPAHVAHALRAAYGVQVPTATVIAWEQGRDRPTEKELTALAGALWCAPGELLGVPRTLREYRLARGIGVVDLAMAIGMDVAVYQRAENDGRWDGNDRQAAELADALALPLSSLIRFTGRAPRLTEMLVSAATTRWQGYVGPVRETVGLPKRDVQDALAHVHKGYQTLMAASTNWGEGSSSHNAGRAGAAYLADIQQHFWDRLGERGIS